MNSKEALTRCEENVGQLTKSQVDLLFAPSRVTREAFTLPSPGFVAFSEVAAGARACEAGALQPDGAPRDGIDGCQGPRSITSGTNSNPWTLKLENNK